MIEFTIKENRTTTKKLLQELKDNPNVYNLISGLDSSSQIETLFFVIRVVGGFFLLFLAISVFFEFFEKVYLIEVFQGYFVLISNCSLILQKGNLKLLYYCYKVKKNIQV